MVEVKASEPRHVLKLLLGVNKGMLPVKYFHSTKRLFMSVEVQVDHKTVIKLRSIWQPSVLEMLPDLRQWGLSVCVGEF